MAGRQDGVVIPKVNYRFSPGKVHGLVERFSAEQRAVVKSIGFGGLLQLPRYTKLGRDFTVWVFSQIITMVLGLASLFMAGGTRATVPITARDVHDILEIPLVGSPVGQAPSERDTAAVCQALGLEPGRVPSLKAK